MWKSFLLVRINYPFHRQRAFACYEVTIYMKDS